ncbi:MAG: ECF transporter S component [Candidatus Aenigmarchaeota archaeon]|nr:ECF transporter S component [Candidatus Aenigmarchaeota archaeon]
MKIDFKKKFKLSTLEIVLIAIGAVLYAIFSIPTMFVIAFSPGGPVPVQFRPAVIIPSAMAVLFGPLVGGFSAGIGTTIASAVKHGAPSPATIFGGLPGNFFCYFIIGLLTKDKKSIKELALTSAIGYTVGGLIIGLGMYSVGLINEVEIGTIKFTPIQVSFITAGVVFITGYIMTLIGTPILVRAYLSTKGK